MLIVSHVLISTLLLITTLSECDENVNSNNAQTVPFIDLADNEDVYFHEQFVNKESINRWVQSKSKKPDTSEDIAQYDGKWEVEVPASSVLANDFSLALKSKARHHAISTKFNKQFDFRSNSRLIVQYEVKFANTPECSGAYIKLFADDSSLDEFNSQTGYSIMFGPDKCGINQKCHFIIRFRNPKTLNITEHHATKLSELGPSYFNDQQTHIYRLELSDNKYRIIIDKSVIESGDLLKDLSPPIQPPRFIDDPTDEKPDDWDEREMITDQSAIKPSDWNDDEPMEVPDITQTKPSYWLDEEPTLVPDEDAVIPDDYDEEIDGKWEPPLIDNEKCVRNGERICGEWKPSMIPNPKYRGKWSPPLIKNPAYKGIWKPRQIPNEDYFEFDGSAFSYLSPIDAIGLELWSMTDDIYFDNFIVSKSTSIPDKFVTVLWQEKYNTETPKSSGKVEAFMNKAAKRPFVYSTIVIIVFVSVVAVIGWFTKPKKTSDVGETKKTDQITEDDETAQLVKSHLDNDIEETEPASESTLKRRKRSTSRKSQPSELSEDEAGNDKN